jgi:hypothetical protein
LKKAVVILSALLLLATLVFAGEKVADKKDKTSCAEKCKTEKGAAVCPGMKSGAKSGMTCPGMKGDAKATSGDTKMTGCPMHAGDAKAEAETKSEATACSGKLQSSELMQFHEAMHPMALAIGFEGEAKPDLAKFRTLYPAMKEKVDALAAIPVDDKIATDPKAFTEKRAELAKNVSELGIACQGKDDAVINPAFQKVHESYVQLKALSK